MEEPELRVGGWEKQGGRRWFRRIFALILVSALGTLILGPTVVDYRPAYVSSDSMYFPTLWNGPFDIDYSKEFNGHLKISSISYESSDSESGKLIVISISSLIDLDILNMQTVIIEKVESKARDEGLELKNGKIINEDSLEIGDGAYQWDANVTEKADFFKGNEVGSEIIVKAYFWTIEAAPMTNQLATEIQEFQTQTVICIAFGIDIYTINQATEMIGNVKI